MLKWLKSIFNKEKDNLQDRLLDKTAYLTFDSGTTIGFNKEDLYSLTVEYTNMSKYLNNNDVSNIDRLYLIINLDGQPGPIFASLLGKDYTHLITPDGLLTIKEFVSNKDGIFSKVAGKYINKLISLIDQGYVIYPPGVYFDVLNKAYILPIVVTELKGEQLTENNYFKRYSVASKDMIATVNKLEYDVVITALYEQAKDKNN